MWIDDNGVCHTVALPEPRMLMSDAFQQSLERTLTRDREELASAIELEQVRVFGMVKRRVRSADESDFAAAIPPPNLLSQQFNSVNELQRLIRQVDFRWRLDALEAIEDCIP
jgi:hypothetical protein